MTESGLVSLLAELRSAGWDPGAAAGWDPETTARNYGRIVKYGGFYAKTLPLACVTVELLARERPDTVRGVMYSVVSAGWLPDTSRRSYGRVQRILNKLRKRRVVPFDWVADNIRSTQKPSSWSGLEDFADSVRNAYRRDFWASLPEYVHIICEKDTVAGRIGQVTGEYDVALSPLRGYSSTTFAAEIANEWERIAKPIHCYYVGDHDPSGRDLERDITERLSEFGAPPFHWHRLAVRGEHFDRYGLIPLRPKRKDSRHDAFVETYGPRCAEVEAIPANELREMVTEAIESHIPPGEWQRLQEIERQERESFNAALNALSA